MTEVRPSRRGFSLIEVVIAIAIAGIAFFVLTETFFNVLLTLEGLESESDYQKDVRFVRRQIIQITDRDELEDGGEITTLDLGTADWYATLEATEIVDLFRVDLEIEFENPEGEPIDYLETLYLLRPTWSDPIESSAILSEARDRIEEENLRRDW
ncbi:MAG: prepilin-type N-terminal cleavage/methylation domain-containing protein [Oceanipulchritudo sp.]